MENCLVGKVKQFLPRFDNNGYLQKLLLVDGLRINRRQRKRVVAYVRIINLD